MRSKRLFTGILIGVVLFMTQVAGSHDTGHVEPTAFAKYSIFSDWENDNHLHVSRATANTPNGNGWGHWDLYAWLEGDDNPDNDADWFYGDDFGMAISMKNSSQHNPISHGESAKIIFTIEDEVHVYVNDK